MSFNPGDFVLIRRNKKKSSDIAHLKSIKGDECEATFYLRPNQLSNHLQELNTFNNREIFLDASENGCGSFKTRKIISKCLVEQCPEEIDPAIFISSNPELPVFYVRKAFDGYQLVSLESPLKSPLQPRKTKGSLRSPSCHLDFNKVPPNRKSTEPLPNSPSYRLRSPLAEMSCKNLSETKIVLTKSKSNTPSKDTSKLRSPSIKSKTNTPSKDENQDFDSSKLRDRKHTKTNQTHSSGLRSRSATTTPCKEGPISSPKSRTTRNTPCKDDSPLVSLLIDNRSREMSPLSSPLKELSLREERDPTASTSCKRTPQKQKPVVSLESSPRTPRRACKDQALLRLENLNKYYPVNKFLDLDNPPRARKTATRRVKCRSGSPISPLAKSNNRGLASPLRHLKKLTIGSPKFQAFRAPCVNDYDDNYLPEHNLSSDSSESGDSSDESYSEEIKVSKKFPRKSRTNKKRPMESPIDQEFAFVPKRSNIRRTGGGLEEARARLHVAAVPKNLPCRDEEFEDIHAFVEGKLIDGVGGCIYISGLPGTGKTATVHEVMRSLEEDKDLPEFLSIEVNGMRVTEPNQAFVYILQKLTGKKATPKHAAQLLEKEFSSKKHDRKPCVLIVDELDLLCTKKQEVLYNLFDWPGQPKSRLIVVAIANTMDLPERLLHHRVASRLGLTRLTFQPYTHQQLNTIVATRLQGLSVFEAKAVELAARKVAAVSGDARRALDICRRATELAETRHKPARAKDKRECHVEMEDIDAAIKEMFSSAKLTAIRCCSVYEKLFLRGLVSEFQRTGLEEARLDRVMGQMVALCRIEDLPTPCTSEIFAICASLGSHKLLLCESSRQDSKLMIRLNCGQHDITFALKDAVFRVI